MHPTLGKMVSILDDKDLHKYLLFLYEYSCRSNDCGFWLMYMQVGILVCSPTNTNFMYVIKKIPSPKMSVRRGPSVHTFTFVEMVVTRAAESTRSLVEDDNWGVVGDVAMMIIEELLCSLKCQENLSKFLFHTVISSFFRFCLNILTMSTFNNLQV